MRVPQAEPVNFARALIHAAENSEAEVLNEQIVVRLLGLSAERETDFKFGLIETIPYFGNPDTIKNYVDDDTTVIIWQGGHCMGVNAVKEPTGTAKPVLIIPYAADNYSRLNMIKVWQTMMYNLASSKVLENVSNWYFIETDARLPLLDMNKIDPNAVPKPLPKHIKLITQAHYAEEFRRWNNKYGNGQSYNEVAIGDYCYQFAPNDAAYMPLHILPEYSHSKFKVSVADKTIDRAIFQVQSLKYMDDYRKSALKKACNALNGNVTLQGRFLAEERAIAQYALGNYGSRMTEFIRDNSASPECFDDSAKYLAQHKQSIIITDARYERFGLCPNRLVEALAVHTFPFGQKSVVTYCDDTIKSAWSTITDAYEQCIFLDSDELDAEYDKINAKLTAQLDDYMHKFIDNALFDETL